MWPARATCTWAEWSRTADATKAGILGVPEAILELHGAVSAETAAELARGARSTIGADVAVSVTGIAGPGGGTQAKPVGLVFVHAETGDESVGRRLELPGDREAIRERATAIALHLLRTVLARSGDEAV